MWVCLSVCLFFKQDHTLQLRLSWKYATLAVLKLPAILSARIKNTIHYAFFLIVHLFLYLDTGSYSFKVSLHLQYWGCMQETSVGIPGMPHHNLKVYLVLWTELRLLWIGYFSGAVTKHLQNINKTQWATLEKTWQGSSCHSTQDRDRKMSRKRYTQGPTPALLPPTKPDLLISTCSTGSGHVGTVQTQTLNTFLLLFQVVCKDIHNMYTLVTFLRRKFHQIFFS